MLKMETDNWVEPYYFVERLVSQDRKIVYKLIETYETEEIRKENK